MAPAGDVTRLLVDALAADDARLARRVVEALIDSAMNGNMTALKELIARIEGSPEPADVRVRVVVVPKDGAFGD